VSRDSARSQSDTTAVYHLRVIVVKVWSACMEARNEFAPCSIRRQAYNPFEVFGAPSVIPERKLKIE
jgi:hypothetical protein